MNKFLKALSIGVIFSCISLPLFSCNDNSKLIEENLAMKDEIETLLAENKQLVAEKEELIAKSQKDLDALVEEKEAVKKDFEKQVSDLNSKISENQNAIEALKKEKNEITNSTSKTIQELNEQIAQNATSIDTLKADKEKLKKDYDAQITELNTSIETKSSEIDSLNETITTLNDSIETCEEELATLKAEKETSDATYESTISTLEGQVSEKEASITLLNTNLSDLQTQYDDKVAELNSTLEAKESEKVSYEARISELENQAGENESEIARLKGLVNQSNLDIERLTNEKSDLVKDYESQITTLNSTITNNTNEIAKLNENISTLTTAHNKEKENYEKLIAEKDATIKSNTKSINDLTIEKENLITEKNTLSNQYAELDKNNKALQSQYDKLIAEKENEKNTYEKTILDLNNKHQLELNNLNAQLDSKTSENASLNDQLNKANADFKQKETQFNNQISKLNTDISKLETENKNLKDRIAELEKVTYCTVTFDPQNGDAITTTSVEKGNRIPIPEIPIKEGYVFDSWRTENSNKWQFDIYDCTHDTKLVANYVPNEYKIIFDYKDTSPKTVKYGEEISFMPDAYKTGYKFIGWEYNGELLVRTELYKYTHDITVTPVFGPFYTITFDSGAGTAVEPIGIIGNDTDSTYLPNSLRDGYKLIGWQYNGKVIEGNVVYRDTFTEDITVTAVWKEIVGNFDYIELSDGTLEIAGYYGLDGNVQIPTTINGKIVTRIGDDALVGLKQIVNLTIPEGITHIGVHSFGDCVNLENIRIPNSLISLEDRNELEGSQAKGAFLNCPKLKKTAYNNALYIGNEDNPYIILTDIIDATAIEFKNHPSAKFYQRHAFQVMKQLQQVELTDSIISPIHFKEFADNKNLISAKLGHGIPEIGDLGFSRCDNLTNLIIGDGCKAIKGCAIDYCFKLQNIVLGKNIVDIYPFAFDECSVLQNVFYARTKYDWEHRVAIQSLGNGYLERAVKIYYSEEVPDDIIEKYWRRDRSYFGVQPWNLYDYNDFIYFNKPDGTIHIAKYNGVLSDINLENFFVSPAVTSIGNGAFADNDNITRIIIPNTVTEIGSKAFANCKLLNSIEIKGQITEIKEYTFAGCNSLKNMLIPGSVNTIGQYAFNGCDSLYSVIFGGTQDQWYNINRDVGNDVLGSAQIQFQ